MCDLGEEGIVVHAHDIENGRNYMCYDQRNPGENGNEKLTSF